MPPRKEPKENVVYAASKRKAPPFKPVRPSQVPRIPTTESEASTTSRPFARPTTAKRKPAVLEDSDDGSEKANAVEDDSDEELADNPLQARPRPTVAAKAKKLPPARKPSRQPSPMDISDDDDLPSPDKFIAADDVPPDPSQSDPSASIPQALLTRLLHEHFTDKSTKIDKQALQVFQKYIDTFVREAIARAAAQKREGVEAGTIDELDAGWLELEDLEKVAGSLVLDF